MRSMSATTEAAQGSAGSAGVDHVHPVEHVIAATVAVGVVGVALPGGGYGSEFRAGAALLVWWAVAAGIVFGLWPRARAGRSAIVAGGGLLALTILSALSMGWAGDGGAAFEEVVRVAGYLGLFALVVVAAPAGSARAWITGLALGLGVVCALALASRVQPSLFPRQDLIELLPSVKTRLSYPLNYWNGLGAFAALAAVLLAWLGANARSRAGRALATAAIAVPGLTLYLTSSRGGVIALGVGLVVLLAAGPARARLLGGVVVGGGATAILIAIANGHESFVDGRIHAPDAASQGHEMLAAAILVAAGAALVRLALDRPLARLRVPRTVAVALGAACAAAAVVAVAASDPGHRIDEFKKPPAAPGAARGFVARHLGSAEGNGRYQFWSAGVDAFRTEPLRGVGAGGYEAWWTQHGSLPYFIRNAHSEFVEVMAELGLLGLIALLAFLAPAFTAAAAARRAAAAAPVGAVAGGCLAALACGVTSAALDWTWQLPAAFAPVVVLAAVAAGPALRPAGRAGGSRFGVGIGLLLVAWVAAVASTIALVEESKLGDSRQAARRGDLAAAATAARQAQAIEPWSGAASLQLALVRERQGDLPGARRAIRMALDDDPGDWRPWLVATRLATKAGDIPDARRSLRRARMLNPRSAIFAAAAPQAPQP
jgi:O-antigen ligase